MPAILALDQGTTSSRAIVFDEQANILGVAQKEFPQFYPQNGWVEHAPEDLWATQNATAVEAIARAGLATEDIAAMGITNQRETTLVWDRATLKPIYPAIVWQDRRTASIVAGLEPYREQFIAQTGLRLDPYFSGTKLAWILDHVPGARQKAENGKLAFGTVDTWLLAHLTQGKVHATDASNASRTLLFNIHTGQWDSALLDILNIPDSLLPEVKDSSGYFGTAQGALAGIPIHGIAGDQQAALFGQRCFLPGQAKNTYGTGCFLLMNTGEQAVRSHHGLITTIAWQIQGKRTYALEGSVFIGGAVIQWLRDNLNFFTQSADSATLANHATDNGGVVFIPAFTGLGAPYWNPHARGAIFGLTRGTTQAQITKAALESIALQSMDVLDAMRQDLNSPLQVLRVDGGAAHNDLLLQTQADLLQVPVVKPSMTELTALGAAYLAGLSVGIWDGLSAINPCSQTQRIFKPNMQPAQRQVLINQWQEAIARLCH